MIGLGLFVLVFGNRLAIFGAGVGALLGVGILRILPGTEENWLQFIIPIGLSILFALGAGITKGLISLLTLVIGGLAGGSIVLAGLDQFGLDWGFINWILALVGAIIGAGLASRFKDWAVIILAAIVGALLTVRGLQMLMPTLQEPIATITGFLLGIAAIAYHGGFFRRNKSKK
jgi:hypothetical protein